MKAPARARRWSVTWLVLMLVACDSSKRSTAVQPALTSNVPEEPPVVLEPAGCAAVARGPVCTLPSSHKLLLWCASALPLTAANEAGAKIPLEPEPALGGVRYTLAVPPGSQELRVASASGKRLLTLLLRAEAPLSEALVQARSLREAGSFAQARSVLTSFIASQQDAADSTARDAARSLLARISMGEGHDEQALSEFRASLERSIASGRISDAMLDAGGIVHLALKKLQRPDVARAALAQVRELVREDPSSSAILTYNEGSVALDTGDYRSALQASREAHPRLARLGLARYAQFAREQEAVTLGWLGRYSEAIALQRKVVEAYASADACQLVDRQDGIVWMAQRGELDAHNELGKLAREHAQLAESTLSQCEDPFTRRNHELSTIELALRLGDLADAARHVQRLDAVRDGQTPELSTMEQEVRARFALSRHQYAQAQRGFAQALDLARQHSLWESEYLALLGLARSYPLQHERALQSYRDAEQLLDDVLDRVPLSEGRAGFSSARAAGTREYIERLLQLSRPADALAVVQRARTRVLATLARANRVQRLDPARRSRWEAAIAAYKRERALFEGMQVEAWRKPTAELPAHEARMRESEQLAHAHLDAVQTALGELSSTHREVRLAPAADEAIVAYFRGSSALLAFVQTQATTRAFQLADADGGSIVEPLADAIRGIKRLRVMVPSHLTSLDVHALPLAGQPLLQTHEVVYELSVPSTEVAAAGPPIRDVIVANPDRTLPGAEAEAELVHAAWVDAALWKREAASRDKLLAALPGARRFYFAGHARYAGVEGIDSALVLADGDLALGEILMLTRAPVQVVLSGCETARGGGTGTVEGMGLAQAFVVAGAQLVIASPRPVDDNTSREFFQDFARAEGGPIEAWRSAALHALARGRSDWSAYRILVP